MKRDKENEPYTKQPKKDKLKKERGVTRSNSLPSFFVKFHYLSLDGVDF